VSQLIDLHEPITACFDKDIEEASLSDLRRAMTEQLERFNSTENVQLRSRGYKKQNLASDLSIRNLIPDPKQSEMFLREIYNNINEKIERGSLPMGKFITRNNLTKI
jgi:hypothetical protein